jgi:TonB-dependent starch-binding outer membrane protein SusC
MNWNKVVVLVLAISLSVVSSGQKTKKNSDKPVTITGKVVAQNNEPIADAVLYIDNMKTSTYTESDGYYKIKVSPSALNLEVRSEKYGSFVTPINGQTTINFTLNGAESMASLPANLNVDNAEEGKDKKSRSVGKKMNTYNDIYQMIRMEVSGVVVSGRSIQIKQGHSFIGTKIPLFVINGVIVNTIDNVNPVDVKSIRVLTGSQAAIYGVNGSNGVISITLKNGTEKEN